MNNFFEIKKNLHFAFNSLRVNRGRTILTILGIVVGIASVIVVMSAGRGLERFIMGQVEAFGSDYVEVEVKIPNTKQTSTENAMGMALGPIITTLKLKDAEAIAKHPNISYWYAGNMAQEIVSYRGEIKKSMLFGVSADFTKIDKGELAAGRFFTEEEDRGAAQVAVLGSKVKDTLFGDRDPLGENIKIKKSNYRVIGVMESRGNVSFFDFDSVIFVSVITLHKKISGIDYVSFIIAQMIDPSLGDQTAEDITLIMREEHDITDPDKDDFAVITMEQAAKMIKTVVDGITILLILIASISLIVGGVGIMNIMYFNVTERTYEIGLRKSLGATKRDILYQFLSEAIAVTFAGGVAGIIVGVIFSALIALLSYYSGFSLGFNISLSSVIIAVGFSVAVGLIFGLYPARKAAALYPIEALRRE